MLSLDTRLLKRVIARERKIESTILLSVKAGLVPVRPTGNAVVADAEVVG
jgi:hypothetical protein